MQGTYEYMIVLATKNSCLFSVFRDLEECEELSIWEMPTRSDVPSVTERRTEMPKWNLSANQLTIELRFE